MDLLRIAARVAADTLLDAVRESCPGALPDVGGFVGSGKFGEVYELPGGDEVLKVSVAKDEVSARSVVDRLRSLMGAGSDALASVTDAGVLCEVSAPGSPLRVKSGVAYYYVMERMEPLSPDERKVAFRTLSDLKELRRSPGYALERKKYEFSRRRQYVRDGDIEPSEPNAFSLALDLFDRMDASGVSHSDMNPSNIMSAADGRYKLVDLESASA